MTTKPSDGPAPFQQAPYARLLAAARRSLERTGGSLDGSVSVSAPDDAERKAIIGITGQYREAGVARLTVRLADLDAAVREAGSGGLGLPCRSRASRYRSRL
jgi:hypothetical protein